MAKDYFKGKKILKSPSHFIDEANESIEEIRRNNSLVEWFKKYNITLEPTEKGGEYKGVCPWHNDNNLSLLVSEDKMYFECSTCSDKKGDVITLVMLMEGVTTSEAIKRLNEDLNKITKEDVKEVEIEPKEPKEEEIKIASEIPRNDGEIGLIEVVEFYHKKLYETQSVIDLLKGFNLDNTFWRLFKLGACNGKLLDITSQKQKEWLKKTGFLDENYIETLLGYLTIPIIDENDIVTGIFGLDTTGCIKAIGNTKTIFNLKLSKMYDELIFTDNFNLCFKLIGCGFNNVICANLQDFDAKNLKLLKDARVKTLIVVSESTSNLDLLKDVLLEDFRVKLVQIEENKAISKSEILTLIEKSELFKPKNDNDFSVKREGNNYIFTIGEINYKLFDVKELSISNLKVSIKAEYQEERFPDKIDLYSSRSRNSFSLTLSQKFNIEVKRVENDLLKIVDYMEYETMKRLNPKTPEKYEMTEEEIKLGLEFLKSPDIFYIIVKDMEVLGYVGEDMNKILLYIGASSRILDDPISVMIISQSAAGKSMLVDVLRKLLPPEDVIALTSLSDQALNYIEDLLHKFLIMGEAVHNDLIEHQIREMLSNKELSRLVTTKDDKTGKMKSENFVTKAIVSMVLGGTRYDVNPENASRFFIVNADESKEQTKRIHEAQKSKYSIEKKYLKEDVIPNIIKKHQSAQRLLKKITIVNPFRQYLSFPVESMRFRRDFERFIDLIACVCFVRQCQKELKDDGRFKYIECDLVDYEIGYKIMVNNVLPATMLDTSVGAISLYEDIRKMVSKIATDNNIKLTDANFIQKEVREFTKLNMDTIKKHLRVLVSNEYIQLVGGKTRGTRFSYKLREDKEIEKIDVSMIPTPKDMKMLIESSN